ncbi:MAG: hypothetical protein M0P74_15660 [Syntrophales bacterium]|jgi:hypothetical protein|nr:hypothetical protein [Syntrophales bacterium]
MKYFLISFTLFLGILSAFPAPALASDGKSAEALLADVDVARALAIANEWKWSQKEIKSLVNSREVVFQFPDGKVKKIPLPEDKMVVALAPYIQKTHT